MKTIQPVGSSIVYGIQNSQSIQNWPFICVSYNGERAKTYTSVEDLPGVPELERMANVTGWMGI